VIDAGPVQQQSAPEPDILSEVAALQTKLSPPHATLLGDAHADLVGATSEAQLRTVWEEVNRLAREAKLDKDTIKLLTRIKDARKQELTREV
jgi:diadenosine tetraphosphate (Ap4A) HIT family hydrolase